jgi:uncharacterized protein (TIGR03435 family)
VLRRNFPMLIAVISVGTATAPFVRSQTDVPMPKWEVVSIKLCSPGGRGGVASPQGPGRLTMPCVPLELLIHHSYLLFPNGTLDLAGATTQVVGGPAWMYSEPYTIEAKAEVAPGQSAPGRGTMQGPMLRALLADRFKLELHRGTRQVPVYALTVAKGGRKLQPAPQGSCVVQDPDHPQPPPAPGQARPPLCGLPVFMNNGMDFYGATMTQLCATLSNRTDRKVIDKTGIGGMFDIRLNTSATDGPWGPPPPPPALPQPGDPPPAASDPGEVTVRIQNALQKLGLKLESAQGPEDVLIVDHVERPSEN